MQTKTWKLFSINLIGLLLASFALASEPQEIPAEPIESPQLFTQWKSDQVTEAHNYSVRVRNQLHIASSLRGKDSQDLTHKETINKLKQELRSSQQRLAVAQELCLDDYFEIYLQQFKENPMALQSLAEKLPPEEIFNLLGRLLKTPTPQASEARIR